MGLRTRILLLVTAVLLSACAMRPAAPVFQGLSDFRINRDNPDKAVQVEVGARVFNPNRFKIKVLDYDLQLFVNGAQIGRAQSKVNQVMAKEAATDLVLGVRSSLKEILGGTAKVLLGLGSESITLRITGTVRARARGFTKRFPIDVERGIPFKGK